MQRFAAKHGIVVVNLDTSPRKWTTLSPVRQHLSMLNNYVGGQGNSEKRCWYMHFKSSLVPHLQLKLVNKFGNLSIINCQC